MSEVAVDPKEKFAFLKQPIAASEDGVSCIVIHEKAHTELGRLLAFTAKVPFAVYGKPNPDSLSGEWETFEDAVMALTQGKMHEWIDLWRKTPGTHVELERGQKTLISNWYLYRFMQNWYLKDLLLKCKLPMVFAHRDVTIDTNGNKIYHPIESYEFVLREVRNYRYQEARKLKAAREKDDKRQYKKELKSGGNPDNPNRRKPKR